MVESEFGHHEDGLPNLSEDAEEIKRLAQRGRKQGKKFLTAEDVPSTELDPLERLIHAEEAGGAPEDILEDDAGEIGDLDDDANGVVVSPAPEKIREARIVDERTVVHGSDEWIPGSKNGKDSGVNDLKRNFGKDPKYKDKRRG